MRLSQLLQEQEHASVASKRTFNEFKELAKRYQLTLKHGMGWPNITTTGAWMGGSLAPLRGISDADAALSIEKRRTGFIRAVAKKLEQLAATGSAVMIGRGRERSSHTEPAETGKIEHQLFLNMVNTHPPGGRPSDGDYPTVIWYISHPEGVTSTSFIELSISMIDPDEPRHWLSKTLVLSLPNDHEFEKTFTAWATSVQPTAKFTQKDGWVTTPRKNSHHIPALVADLMELYHSLGGDYLPKIYPNERFTPANPNFSFIKKRVAGRGTKVVPITDLLPVMRKYGLSV